MSFRGKIPYPQFAQIEFPVSFLENIALSTKRIFGNAPRTLLRDVRGIATDGTSPFQLKAGAATAPIRKRLPLLRQKP